MSFFPSPPTDPWKCWTPCKANTRNTTQHNTTQHGTTPSPHLQRWEHSLGSNLSWCRLVCSCAPGMLRVPPWCTSDTKEEWEGFIFQWLETQHSGGVDFFSGFEHITVEAFFSGVKQGIIYYFITLLLQWFNTQHKGQVTEIIRVEGGILKPVVSEEAAKWKVPYSQHPKGTSHPRLAVLWCCCLCYIIKLSSGHRRQRSATRN